MTLRRRGLQIFAVFLTMFLVLNQTYVSADTTALSVQIVDAWYADGQGDGVSNDAFALVNFTIDNTLSSNVVNYSIQLILPSGTNYTYYVHINTTQHSFQIKNNFWNHATELGWYTVIVIARLNNSCHSVSDRILFDPPGDDTGDPLSFTTG